MKYSHAPEAMTPEDRTRANAALVYLARTQTLGDHGVSLGEVYSGYTGKGGLHGLRFEDFDSFYEYTMAKQAFEHGEFFTPHDLAQAVVENLGITEAEQVLDPTCGAGVFFNFLPAETNATGVELDPSNAIIARTLYPEATIHHSDIREWTPERRYDVAVCNPPFNLDFSRTPSQEYILTLLGEAVRPGGLVALIVPSSFGRDDYATRERRVANEAFSFLGEWAVPRAHFASADIDIKVMLFSRISAHLPVTEYNGGTPEVTTLTALGQQVRAVVGRHRTLADSKRALLQREAYGLSAVASSEFEYRVTKLLYDISTLKDPKKDSRARAVVHEFATQKQPEGMEWEKWVQVRLTEGKVLSRLQRMMRRPVPEEDRVALVRRPGGLQRKGYSARTRRGLDRTVHRLTDPATRAGQYGRLVRRKRALCDLLATPYEQLSQEQLAPFLDHIDANPLHSATRGEVRLNKVQRLDTARMLAKPYGYLQWDTGAGKTVSALVQSHYRLPSVHNIFVVSTALAINNNLAPEFSDFDFSIRVIRSLKDVEAIEAGEVVFLTFNMLSKYQKQIKKRVKLSARKVMLILDEADGVANLSSKRSKAVLDCFRRARYKLLMSATSTRNNVSEAFTAFELMYNNSEAFMDWCTTVYEERRTDDGPVLAEKDNAHYGQPFAAYKKGLGQFKRAFSPSRSSVFGVQKHAQTVHNAARLRPFVQGSMLTRTFEEITGRDLVTIEQCHVTSNPEEAALYASLLEEFEEYRRLYASTGVARKDAMLRIIQQLNALLVAPTYPQKFNPGVTSSKVGALMKYVAQRPGEQVAVGLTHVAPAQFYAAQLRRQFPGRRVFLVTGEGSSLAQRRQVIADLRASGNGILVCTQQAFASSINIDFVDHVILLEMQWNFAAMKQFFTRFARFTSRNAKTVTFLLNRTSIETNLVRLLIEKEQMNGFMRGDYEDFDGIAQNMGLDDDFFDALLSVEHDERGHRAVGWRVANPTAPVLQAG